MSETKFERGQRVYNEDGYAAEYVQEVDGAHAVRPLRAYDDGSDDEPDNFFLDDEIVIWPRVFLAAPRAKLDAEIRRLQQQAAEIRREVAELNAERLKAKADQREVMERLQQHEALRYLDNFLNATITHYVAADDGMWLVMDTEQFQKARSFGYSEKLLTLYATTRNGKTTLEWKFSAANRDQKIEIYAFPSEELARAKVREVIAKQLQHEIGQVRQGYHYGVAKALANAKAHAVEVPAELTSLLAHHRRATAEKALEAARAALAKAEGDMQALAPSVATA